MIRNNSILSLILVLVGLFVNVHGGIKEFDEEYTLSRKCDLTYNQPIDNKPDLFASFEVHNICRINSGEDRSSLNYFAKNNDKSEFPKAGINFDVRENVMFYLASSTSDGQQTIYKVQLNNSHTEAIYKTNLPEASSERPLMNYIVYDWISKNIYIEFHNNTIGVINLKSPTIMKTLVNDTRSEAFAVHPNKGYMFYNSYHDNGIYRTNLDGSGRIRFDGALNSTAIGSFAIDFYNDRLYWTMINDTIGHSNLDGDDMQYVFLNLEFLQAGGLAVDKNYVYYVTSKAHGRQHRRAIHRLNKISEAIDSSFHVYSGDGIARLIEIKIYDSGSQKIRDDHPCKDNNGGCERFCFAVPNSDALMKVCQCGDYEKLAADGRSCVKRN